jgi:dihydroorotase
MPAAAEEVVVARDLMLARLTSGRLHLRHLSTAGSLELVRAAKAEGLAVTCEVAPHHFSLTDEDLAGATYNSDWKVNPPLRSADHLEAVKQALYDGTVDAIASDHTPQHRDDKELDFSEAPSGVVGLETAVSLAVDRLVHGKVIGIGRLVRLFSIGPAQAFGLPGGTLSPGSPADVTILDLRRRVTVDPKSFRSRSRNTPFAGIKLRGAPVVTIVGGRIVWRAEG